MPNYFSPSNPNSSQNSANTPDYSPNPDSTNTPDTANSPDSTNNASLNTGNSDNKIFLLKSLLYLINSDWLISFLKNYPRLGNVLAILIPILSFFLGTSPSAYSDWVMPSKNNWERKIDLENICQNGVIQEQMLQDAINQGLLDKEDRVDKIEPVGLKKAENDKRYPVFRWQCLYKINKEGTKTGDEPSPILTTQSYRMGLDLDEYCEKQADDNNTNLIRAAYHNYRDPHSFYCVNPYPN